MAACARDGVEAEDGERTPAVRIGRVVEVTDGTIEYRRPVWSPDSKKLAFSGSDWRDIYVRRADGSGPIRKVRCGDGISCILMWTADSKAMVCRLYLGTMGVMIGRVDVVTGWVDTLAGPFGFVDRFGLNSLGDVTFMADSETKVLDTVTGGVKSVDEYHSKERPGSAYVEIEMDYRNRTMWIVEGGGAKRTEFPYKVSLASLSPTLDRVAFSRADGYVYVSRLDGSSMVKAGYGCREAWSPDGKRLVYLGAIRQDHFNVIAADLFVVNADGGGAVRLTDTRDTVEDYPVWSPDGTRIAYSDVRTGKVLVADLEELR